MRRKNFHVPGVSLSVVADQRGSANFGSLAFKKAKSSWKLTEEDNRERGREKQVGGGGPPLIPDGESAGLEQRLADNHCRRRRE
ncbi:unnamed protein product [Victoria cruziana]